MDGRVGERNLSEKDHSLLLRYFTFLFMLRRDVWGVDEFLELGLKLLGRAFEYRTCWWCGLEFDLSGFLISRR